MGAGVKVRCKECGTILQSKYRHDFVSCPCGCFIDGGADYDRRGWPNGQADKWFEEVADEFK